MSTSKFTLSKEQLDVLRLVAPPPPADDIDAKTRQGTIVRITAAAGAGKTTTLLEVARKAAELGHKYISFVTFSKAAARDGHRRLNEVMQNSGAILDARTLHSAAMSALGNYRAEQQEDSSVQADPTILDEKAVREKMAKLCDRDVEDFLNRGCTEHIERKCRGKPKAEAKADRWKEDVKSRVNHYVYKTLQQWCRSPNSFEFLKDTTISFGRSYYPSKLYHEGDGERDGFTGYVYPVSFCMEFYIKQAIRCWEELANFRSYDFEMKRAQLRELPIPGTLLLVDECQDMDGCQVDWTSKQVGKDIFFVGDAAQTIYGFRGAKSKFLMEIPNCKDCQLTQSWRFGPLIASIANVVLMAKEKSPHTSGRKRIWQPYRVQGAYPDDSVATTYPVVRDWKKNPVTLIAWRNATLLLEAVGLIGLRTPEDEPISDGDNQCNNPEMTVSGDPLFEIPKVHVYGKGENSGMKKWRQVINEVTDLYKLFTCEEPDGINLDRNKFPEFAGRKMTWDRFEKTMRDLELNHYSASVSVVNKFRNDTMKALERFETEIMDKNYKEEEADIILTTVHAAKGMEWDKVQVLDDMLSFSVEKTGPVQTRIYRDSDGKKRKSRVPTWQFSFKDYEDTINLVYVACTRAKKVLSVPNKLTFFLQECDTLRSFLTAWNASDPPSSQQTSTIGGDSQKGHTLKFFGMSESIDKKEAKFLFRDVCKAVWDENKLASDQMLMETLLALTVEGNQGSNETPDIVGSSESSDVAAEQESTAVPEVITS